MDFFKMAVIIKKGVFTDLLEKISVNTFGEPKKILIEEPSLLIKFIETEYGITIQNYKNYKIWEVKKISKSYIFLRISSNSFEGNVLKYYVLELKKEIEWILDIPENDLTNFEVPKILELKEKYKLINYTSSNSLIFCHIQKDNRDYICLIKEDYNDKTINFKHDNLLPIIDKKNLFSLSFEVTEKFNIINLKNTKLEEFIDRIRNVVECAKSKGYALNFDFKNLVELNGKIYIFKYNIYDLELENEDIIEKNINTYYPEKNILFKKS